MINVLLEGVIARRAASIVHELKFYFLKEKETKWKQLQTYALLSTSYYKIRSKFRFD
jgi:hypothetical protein